MASLRRGLRKAPSREGWRGWAWEAGEVREASVVPVVILGWKREECVEAIPFSFDSVLACLCVYC